MYCPKCNSKSKVIDIVKNPIDKETYRKRICLKCDYIFYSIEFEVDCDKYFKKKWASHYRKKKKLGKKHTEF